MLFLHGIRISLCLYYQFGGFITWIMRFLHLYGTLGKNENGVGGQWKAATTPNNPHLGLAFALRIKRASICLGSSRDKESGTKSDANTNAVRIRKMISPNNQRIPQPCRTSSERQN